MPVPLHRDPTHQGGPLSRLSPIAEAFGLLIVTLPLAVGLHIPTLWFLLPFAVITLARRPYTDYGLTVQNPGAPRFHLTVIVTIFVPYAIAYYVWARWTGGAVFHLRLPPMFATAVVDQVLLIGLPEEFFFRGYLQTQIDRTCGTPFTFLGARYGAGLPVAATLFAVCHIVYGGPARLAVFFPGLLYGWLRARTDTILVPVFYHAGSNLLMQLLMASLSR